MEGVYPEVHLTVEKFKEALERFPNREYVYFNGHLGDPMMNPDVLEGCQTWSDMGVKKIIFDTNGGLRSEEFWRSLAKIRGVYCTFSIDGLEDTNHIYRRNVKWNKLISNMR